MPTSVKCSPDFPVRKDGGQVVVTVDRVFQSDKDLNGWNSATVPA